MIIKSYDYSHNPAYNKPRFQGSDTWICKTLSPSYFNMRAVSIGRRVWVWVTHSTLTAVSMRGDHLFQEETSCEKRDHPTEPNRELRFRCSGWTVTYVIQGLPVLVHVCVSFRLFITVIQLIITYFSVGRTCNSVYHQNSPQRQEIITSVMRFSPPSPHFICKEITADEGKEKETERQEPSAAEESEVTHAFFPPVRELLRFTPRLMAAKKRAFISLQRALPRRSSRGISWWA